jgi:hypothetical protein
MSMMGEDQADACFVRRAAVRHFQKTPTQNHRSKNDRLWSLQKGTFLERFAALRRSVNGMDRLLPSEMRAGRLDFAC